MQEQAHQQELQSENATAALLLTHAEGQDDDSPQYVSPQSAALQTPRKKRRLHTSQKRLHKVTLPDSARIDATNCKVLTLASVCG